MDGAADTLLNRLKNEPICSDNDDKKYIVVAVPAVITAGMQW
jgi:hypothetical protein